MFRFVWRQLWLDPVPTFLGKGPSLQQGASIKQGKREGTGSRYYKFNKL